MLRTVVSLAIIAACVMAASGCSTIEDAMGHPMYIRGAVNAVEKQPLGKVADATRKAIKAIDYVLTTDEREPTTAVIQGENKFDRGSKVVRVILTALPGDSTEISIRIGRTGDRELAAKLLEFIRADLK